MRLTSSCLFALVLFSPCSPSMADGSPVFECPNLEGDWACDGLDSIPGSLPLDLRQSKDPVDGKTVLVGMKGALRLKEYEAISMSHPQPGVVTSLSFLCTYKKAHVSATI